MPTKALMPIMLVQEHKDKTITHMVHEVLTWFGQPCLRPRKRENDSLYNREYYKGQNQIQLLGSRNITCFLPTPCIPIPYYEPSRSTEYLPFFLTSLSISYSLYRSIGPSSSHDFFPS